MSWIFPWRRRGRTPKKKPAVASEGATRAVPKPPGELFLDAEEAERPVDLSGELEAGVRRPDRAGELREDIQRIRLQAVGMAERELLTALDRGLKSGGLQLPPMPQVVIRVQRLIDSGTSHLRDLAREVELDPALATKVVGIANSPFYAGLEPAQSARDAIIRIGLIETRNILMAIMLRSRVFRVPGFETLTQETWTHALAASVTARALAAQMGIDPDRAFLGGLVHDVGRAVILSLAGDVQRRSRGQVRPDPLALEQVMEALHPRLGAIVTDSWHLGDEIADAIAHHHDPASAEESVRPFASLLGVAGELAKQLVCAAEDSPRGDEIAAARIESIGISQEIAGEIIAECREAFEELAKVL